MPALNELAMAQATGRLILPSKASYAFGKAIQMANPIIKAYSKRRHEIVEATVEKDEKGEYKSEKGANGKNEYSFAEGMREKFDTAIIALNNEEVDFSPHKISKAVLESIDNFPVKLYAVVFDFDMVSEVDIMTVGAVKKMQLAN